MTTQQVAHTPAICVLKKLSARDWIKANPEAMLALNHLSGQDQREVRSLMDEFAEASLEAAAAPELLEALKAGIALVEPLIETDSEFAPEWDGIAGTWLKSALAAISKVEGQ